MALLMIMSLVGTAAAAVVEVISQTAAQTNNAPDAFMQTFTPTQSGFITEVAIGKTYDSGNAGSVVIYDGAGPGTVLGSQPVTWNGSDFTLQTVALDTPIAVTAGSTYTLYPTGVQTSSAYSTTGADPYPGGELWRFNASEWESWNDCAAAVRCVAGNFDLTFSVTIESGPDSDGDGVPDLVDAYPNDPTRAVDCPVGYYGAFDCTPAAPGTYVATSGQLTATPCPVGTFSDTAGSVSCTPAPPGTYVDFEGAVQATPCPLGTYSDVAGSVSCTLAPIGYYVDFTGAVAATQCPADTTTNGIGSASPSDCVPVDTDSDGVPDTVDLCPATALPETPPVGWKQNHYIADETGNFVDPNGRQAGVTIVDTAGCSGAQIIDAAGLGNGHIRFGITKSALEGWIASLG